MSRIERIDIERLRVPLLTPYRLAFGAVEHFDTIIVQITDGDGDIGLGETTVLTGYTDETIEGSWALARQLAANLVALDAVSAAARVRQVGKEFPFTATSFATALEMLAGSPVLRVDRTTRVPLLGLLHGEEEPAINTEVEGLLAAGFRTLKVKVGFDVARDIRRVRAVQNAVAGRARIRLDANQGYTTDQGIAFVRALEPTDIELFEQPCAAGDWEGHLAVARAASVPMMLDESIYGMDDIERAGELHAAAYIKLKLMKLVTLAALELAIDRIRVLGMQPVLGNGVACDVGCWMEACLAARTIDNAGEMNGFMKPRHGVMTTALGFEDGAIALQPGFAPRLKPEHVAEYRVDRATFSPHSAAVAGSAA